MFTMDNEVIEAVCEYYKDDEDTLADCLVYLMSLKCLPLAFASATTLENMNRCPDCGCKLETYTHKEYHSEVDEPPCYETLTEVYCPNCDMPYREGTYV